MSESPLYKGASKSLQPGDVSGQAFGESVPVMDRTPSNRPIKDYSAAHKRRPDMRFWTPEGLEVVTEYSLTHRIGPGKQAAYRESKKIVSFAIFS